MNQKNIDISQEKILENCLKYIKSQAKKFPDKYKAEDIKTLLDINKGQCNGLTALWLYRKLRNEEKEYFFENLKEISQWHDGHKYSKEKEFYYNNLFEQFINDMRWTFGSENVLGFSQTDIDKLLNFVRAEQIVDFSRANKEKKDQLEMISESASGFETEYNLAFVFKINELSETLKDLIPDNKMVSLMSTSHTIGLFKRNGKYILYDSNNVSGEQSFTSTEKLAKAIKSAFMISEKSNNIPVNFRIYREKNQPKSQFLHQEKLIEQFLRKNKDVNRVSLEGYTSLQFAAKMGDMITTRSILKFNPDINKKDKNGNTAMLYAARGGHTDIIRELLRDNANVELKDPFGRTPLFLAILSGNAEAVRLLLANNEKAAHVKNNNGISPLSLAVSRGYSDIVQLLLKVKADPNEKDKWGKTAMETAIASQQPAVVRVLLSTSPKPDPNTKDHEDSPWLILAAMSGNTKIVSELLKAGADWTVKDKFGQSAFFIAVEHGNLPLLKVLLHHVPNAVDFKNNFRKSLLYMAAYRGHAPIVAKLLKLMNQEQYKEEREKALLVAIEKGQQKVINELLKDQNLLSTKDIFGKNLLMTAAFNGQTNIVRELMPKFKLDETDPLGRTALMIAASQGHMDTVNFLLQQSKLVAENLLPEVNVGIEINKALLLAVEQGHLEVAKVLINAGADPNYGNEFGWTSLSLAAKGNNYGILNFLKNNGAQINLLFIKNEKTSPEILEAADKAKEMLKAIEKMHDFLESTLKKFNTYSIKIKQEVISQPGIIRYLSIKSKKSALVDKMMTEFKINLELCQNNPKQALEKFEKDLEKVMKANTVLEGNREEVDRLGKLLNDSKLESQNLFHNDRVLKVKRE